MSDFRSQLQAANIFGQQNRWADAAPILNELATKFPPSVEVLVPLSMVEWQSGNAEAALQRCAQALQLDRACQSALQLSGQIQFQLCRYEQAEQNLSVAWKQAPDKIDLLLMLGMSRLHLGRAEEAIALFERGLRTKPNHVGLLDAKGAALMRLRRYQEARTVLSDVLLKRPSASGFVHLAEAAAAIGLLKEAADAVTSALSMEPDSFDALVVAAKVQAASNAPEKAEVLWTRAARATPNLADWHNHRARTQLDTGKFSQAQKEAVSSLAIRPVQGAAYFTLASAKVVDQEDAAWIVQLDRAIESGVLRCSELLPALFASAKAKFDLGREDEAMELFDRANAVRWRGFDSKAMAASVDATIATFSAESVGAAKRSGLEAHVPVFLVGMLRSGVALVDQILTSHASIAPAGEQGYWSEAHGKLIDEPARRVDLKLAREHGLKYLHQLKSIAPSGSRVTDRNPSNVHRVGLLASVFPSAKFVLVVRDPVDTALSIWMTHLHSAERFVGERGAIVSAIRQVERLEQHWRRVLPKESLIEIRYEELVENPGMLIRKLIAFLGLPWDESCVFPERHGRVCGASGMWRLKQPISPSSREKWRRFEPWLGEFDALRSPMRQD